MFFLNNNPYDIKKISRLVCKANKEDNKPLYKFSN